MCPESPTPPDRTLDGLGHVVLTSDAFGALKRSISELVGPRAAEDALFRVGRRWGEREAELARGDGDARPWLERGLRRLGELGLARVTLRTFELGRERGECRVAGEVADAVELRRATASGTDPEGPICGMTVGYLTGLTAAVSGIDVVCSPFRCVHDCEASEFCRGCGFEILPAARGGDAPVGKPAPSGSARFFLGSLGMSIGDGDISLDDLLENTTDAIILIDTAHVIRFWNRGAERMFQYTRDECLGQRIGFIVPSDLREHGELDWLQGELDREGAVSNHLTRRIRKDGSELQVSLTRNVLHDSVGNVIGSTAILRDVTEEKRTEAELAQARSLAIVGELAAKIAHEVKNPLAGISGAIQLLARDVEPGDRRREMLDEVLHEIRRLDETVLDLLRFARPVPPKPRPTDLRTFVREVVEPLRRNEDVAKQRIEIEIPEGLIVDLDTKLMSQVFTNLVLNAAHAMPAGGTLRIEAEGRGRRVAIGVSDTGPGIPEAALGSIFDPFFTTKARGTGLGLSIARKNVESHAGTLEAESRPGSGARFRITLPLSRDEGPAAREPAVG